MEPNLNSSNDYFPLAIGNIWYYQTYSIDQNGDKRPFYNSMDSVCIVGDTIVNGLHYFQMVSNTCIVGACVSDSNLVRKSGDRIVNQYGGVVLSTTLSEEIQYTDSNYVNSQLFVSNYSVPSLSDTVITNKGEYICLNWKGAVHMQLDTIVEQRPDVHHYFAADIGMVQNKFYNISGNSVYFRELEAYQLY